MAVLSDLSKAMRLLSSPYAGIEVDGARLKADLTLPEAVLRYAIFFTPRSSSSRLTDILTHSRCLGTPDEWFNPILAQRMARNYNAATRKDYIAMLLRKAGQNGIFGVELTYLQLIAAFRGERRFFTSIRPQAVLWLIREDIVAQAVSATRMVQTGVAQSVLASPDDMTRAELVHAYDPAAIRRQLRNLVWMERLTESMLRRRNLSSLRLSYEQLIADSEARTVERVAQFLGVQGPTQPPHPSTHKKLGGDKSLEFSERFRKENPAMIERISRSREMTLAALATSV